MADYATLLRNHVTLTCRSIDRIFLQVYVRKLQTVGWVCQFLRWQRGYVIPSSAAFGKIGEAHVAEVHRWAKENEIPVSRFAKGENKEAIARPLIDAAAAAGGDGVHPRGTVAAFGCAVHRGDLLRQLGRQKRHGRTGRRSDGCSRRSGRPPAARTPGRRYALRPSPPR
jgi:hypothetical protein